jgi:hypothetical protein
MAVTHVFPPEGEDDLAVERAMAAKPVAPTVEGKGAASFSFLSM